MRASFLLPRSRPLSDGWMDGCLIEFLRSRTAVAARLAKEIRAPFKSDNGFLLQHDISSSLSVREKKLSDMSAQSETRGDQVLKKMKVSQVISEIYECFKIHL